MPSDLSPAANQPTDPSGEHVCVESLLATINAGHKLFQNRHNWLSPLTTDEERRQFIAAACNWWNNVVCPSMDRIGARWNEQSQCFELPLTSE